MKYIYDYQNNINIIKTTHGGDVVITMNREILTAIINMIHDAGQYQAEQGYDATARDTFELWQALCEKEEKIKGEQ